VLGDDVPQELAPDDPKGVLFWVQLPNASKLRLVKVSSRLAMRL
jgi:hypothetical protein